MRSIATSSNIPQRQLTRRDYILAAALFGILIAGDFAFTRYESYKRAGSAEVARRKFVIFEFGDNLDQSRLDQALAEFEHAKQELIGLWTRGGDSHRTGLYSIDSEGSCVDVCRGWQEIW